MVVPLNFMSFLGSLANTTNGDRAGIQSDRAGKVRKRVLRTSESRPFPKLLQRPVIVFFGTNT